MGGGRVMVTPSRVNNRADMSKGGGKEAKVEAAAIAFSLKHARVKWTLIEKKVRVFVYIYSFSRMYYEWCVNNWNIPACSSRCSTSKCTQIRRGIGKEYGWKEKTYRSDSSICQFIPSFLSWVRITVIDSLSLSVHNQSLVEMVLNIASGQKIL